MEDHTLQTFCQLQCMACQTHAQHCQTERDSEQREFYNGQNDQYLKMFTQDYFSKTYLKKVWKLYNDLFKTGDLCECIKGENHSRVDTQQILQLELEPGSKTRNDKWHQYCELLEHGRDVGVIKGELNDVNNKEKEKHFEVQYHHAKGRLKFVMRSVHLLRRCIQQLGLRLKEYETQGELAEKVLYQLDKILQSNDTDGSSFCECGIPQVKTVWDLKVENRRLKEKLKKQDSDLQTEKERYQKQKDTLIQENNDEHKAEIDKLCVVNKLKNKVERYKKENKKLRAESSENLRNVEELTKELDDLMEEKNRKELEMQAMWRNHRQELEVKVKTIEELTQRLSAEMSQKVSANESHLENISIRERPMNIASEYEQLCSKQWLQAKSELDDNTHIEENRKIQLLLDILITAESEATRCHRIFVDKLSDILTSPLCDRVLVYDSSTMEAESNKKEKKDESMGGGNTIPIEITNQTGDFLRMRSSTENVQVLVHAIQQTLNHQYTEFSELLQMEGLLTYIQDSAILAWKMVLQRPPMGFKQPGINKSWAGENQQDVFWNSSDPTDQRSRVKFYVYPALYHSSALMTKGRVSLELA